MVSQYLTMEQFKEIVSIESDSWACLNFGDLPVNASKTRVISALKKDAAWQNDHNDEIQKRFEYLIQSIEGMAD